MRVFLVFLAGGVCSAARARIVPRDSSDGILPPGADASAVAPDGSVPLDGLQASFAEPLSLNLPNPEASPADPQKLVAFDSLGTGPPKGLPFRPFGDLGAGPVEPDGQAAPVNPVVPDTALAQADLNSFFSTEAEISAERLMWCTDIKLADPMYMFHTYPDPHDDGALHSQCEAELVPLCCDCPRIAYPILVNGCSFFSSTNKACKKTDQQPDVLNQPAVYCCDSWFQTRIGMTGVRCRMPTRYGPPIPAGR